MVKTGNEREQENAKSVTVPKTETYQYLRITIKEGGNLEEQIKVIPRKCDKIRREIDSLGAKNQVRKVEVKVKLKLLGTCLMIALT